jgi:hypothetical protein
VTPLSQAKAAVAATAEHGTGKARETVADVSAPQDEIDYLFGPLAAFAPELEEALAGAQSKLAEAPKTLARLVSRQERVRIRADAGLLDRVRALAGVLGVDPADDGTAVVSVDSQEAVGTVLAFVVAEGVTDVRTELPSLEEVYLRLVHRNEKRSVVNR